MQDNQLQRIHTWQKELQQFPNKRLHHRLAEALLAAGRPHEALEVAETGLAVHVGSLSCLEVKGAILMALGRWTEAVDVLTQVVQRIGSFEAKFHLTAALYGAAREDEAGRLGDELLKQNPFHPELRRLRAEGKAALPAPVTADRPVTAATPPAEPEPEPEPLDLTPRELLTDVSRKEGTESASQEKALAGLAAATADRLVSDFFDPLIVTGETSSPTGGNGDGLGELAVAIDEDEEIYEPPDEQLDTGAESQSKAVAGQAPEELGEEYDPTKGMEEDLDINEIDVFGELQPGEAAGGKKSAADREAVVVNEPSPPDDPEEDFDIAPDEQQVDPNAEKNRKKFWKTWRSRKERN